MLRYLRREMCAWLGMRKVQTPWTVPYRGACTVM